MAAEALRGVGGILVNRHGSRFVDELERRDVVSAKMHEIIKAGDSPIRLILNEGSAGILKSHCKKADTFAILTKWTDWYQPNSIFI